MANKFKSGVPSPVTLAIPATEKFSDILAGEDLGPADACYIDDANGRAYKSKANAGGSSSASQIEARRVDGYAAVQTKTGDPVTLLRVCVWRYFAVDHAAGIRLYLSSDYAGGLADHRPGGHEDNPQIGLTLSKGRVLLKPSW